MQHVEGTATYCRGMSTAELSSALESGPPEKISLNIPAFLKIIFEGSQGIGRGFGCQISRKAARQIPLTISTRP
jgi:hypothetical protein